MRRFSEPYEMPCKIAKHLSESGVNDVSSIIAMEILKKVERNTAMTLLIVGITAP
jgi:hypothetical protein